MTLRLAKALETDASRIADIHMLAFGSNALLLAQFPTPAVREELKKCIAEKAFHDICDSNIAVLVVRDQFDRIISFAKWSLPVRPGEPYVETPWIWPKGTDLSVIEDWTRLTEAAKSQVLGDAPCYHLTFIGTEPRNERQGAATMLIGWGIQSSDKDGLHAYLEGTLNAGSLYERFGFEAARTIALEIDNVDQGAAPFVYTEKCYTYTPSTLSKNVSD